MQLMKNETKKRIEVFPRRLYKVDDQELNSEFIIVNKKKANWRCVHAELIGEVRGRQRAALRSSEWNHKEVRQFLKRIGLGHYEKALSNLSSGSMLLELTERQLLELGIINSEHKDRLLFEIEGLKALKKYIIHFSEIYPNSLKKFAQGTFSTCYKGLWRGKDVVIKVPLTKPGFDEWSEFRTFLNLPYHNNVLPFLGICQDFKCPESENETHEFCLVTEYHRGSLRKFAPILLNCDSQSTNYDCLNQNLSLLLQILHDMASSISHLHSHGIVHRDIACRNFLVNNDNRILVCDFGLSRPVSEESDSFYKVCLQNKLPLRWMAPESLRYGIFTRYSDVWMLGVAFWELSTLCQIEPYIEIEDSMDILFGVVEKTLILSEMIPNNCPIQLRHLIEQCCQYSPSRRPTSHQIASMIQKMISDQDHNHNSNPFILNSKRNHYQTLDFNSLRKFNSSSSISKTPSRSSLDSSSSYSQIPFDSITPNNSTTSLPSPKNISSYKPMVSDSVIILNNNNTSSRPSRPSQHLPKVLNSNWTMSLKHESPRMTQTPDDFISQFDQMTLNNTHTPRKEQENVFKKKRTHSRNRSDSLQITTRLQSRRNSIHSRAKSWGTSELLSSGNFNLDDLNPNLKKGNLNPNLTSMPTLQTSLTWNSECPDQQNHNSNPNSSSRLQVQVKTKKDTRFNLKKSPRINQIKKNISLTPNIQAKSSLVLQQLSIPKKTSPRLLTKGSPRLGQLRSKMVDCLASLAQLEDDLNTNSNTNTNINTTKSKTNVYMPPLRLSKSLPFFNDEDSNQNTPINTPTSNSSRHSSSISNLHRIQTSTLTPPNSGKSQSSPSLRENVGKPQLSPSLRENVYVYCRTKSQSIMNSVEQYKKQLLTEQEQKIKDSDITTSIIDNSIKNFKSDNFSNFDQNETNFYSEDSINIYNNNLINSFNDYNDDMLNNISLTPEKVRFIDMPPSYKEFKETQMKNEKNQYNDKNENKKRTPSPSLFRSNKSSFNLNRRAVSITPDSHLLFYSTCDKDKSKPTSDSRITNRSISLTPDLQYDSNIRRRFSTTETEIRRSPDNELETNDTHSNRRHSVPYMSSSYLQYEQDNYLTPESPFLRLSQKSKMIRSQSPSPSTIPPNNVNIKSVVFSPRRNSTTESLLKNSSKRSTVFTSRNNPDELLNHYSFSFSANSKLTNRRHSNASLQTINNNYQTKILDSKSKKQTEKKVLSHHSKHFRRSSLPSMNLTSMNLTPFIDSSAIMNSSNTSKNTFTSKNTNTIVSQRVHKHRRTQSHHSSFSLSGSPISISPSDGPSELQSNENSDNNSHIKHIKNTPSPFSFIKKKLAEMGFNTNDNDIESDKSIQDISINVRTSTPLTPVYEH